MRPLRFTLHPSSFILIFLLAAGCARMPHNSVSTVGGDAEGARLDKAPDPERIHALTAEIRGLSPLVNFREAADCARRSVQYSELLRDTYGIKKPIEVNNILVNLHLKERGLCFQLADDLQAELKSQHYTTLRFQRATANWDDLWSEHNCVVVTAPGQPFKQGLVLDPWRNAGTLRWARVYLDHYPWIPRNPTTQPAAPAPVYASQTAK
jgi:hypothetical protein